MASFTDIFCFNPRLHDLDEVEKKVKTVNTQGPKPVLVCYKYTLFTIYLHAAITGFVYQCLICSLIVVKSIT